VLYQGGHKRGKPGVLMQLLESGKLLENLVNYSRALCNLRENCNEHNSFTRCGFWDA